MACVKCDGSDGRNVLAHLVILERSEYVGSRSGVFDVHDVCTAVECLVGTLLEGCEVRYSLTEVADGHQQDSHG